MLNLRKIPSTIVTGFLGAGKTTLLSHVLAHAGGRRIAVIVNEFGELGIDGELLRSCGMGCDEQGGDNGRFIELANGCLCCTVQEAFAPVMERLAQQRDTIDHLVIETSGLALPKPLVQAFQWPTIQHAFTVDAVVTVVDAPAVAQGRFAHDPQAVEAQRRADEYLDHESTLQELFEDQLLTADLVILNKADALSPEALRRVEQQVRSHVQHGVQCVAVSRGQVEVDVLLGMQRAVENVIDVRRTHHDEENDHDHDAFGAVALRLEVTDRARLLEALAECTRHWPIYRIKGFVALPRAAMRLVVQGVGQRFESYFDRLWLPGEPRVSQLVFIGTALPVAALQLYLRQKLGSTVSVLQPQTSAFVG